MNRAPLENQNLMVKFKNHFEALEYNGAISLFSEYRREICKELEAKKKKKR